MFVTWVVFQAEGSDGVQTFAITIQRDYSVLLFESFGDLDVETDR